MRKQAGFTLIELLIVLAILGILVGIVTMTGDGSKAPYFNKYLKATSKYTYTWEDNGANLAVQ
jgi:prepilin-type N-terminal cleavage/methylation domain-containing protein